MNPAATACSTDPSETEDDYVLHSEVAPPADAPLCVDVCPGDARVPGYTPCFDPRLNEIADGSLEVLRASHILEHFSHRQLGALLVHWVRKLKPGGLLKIAVPDFAKIAGAYLRGRPINVQGMVMGAQADERDYHRSIFDYDALDELLREVGLTEIEPWRSEGADTSALWCSLNLQARRPIDWVPGQRHSAPAQAPSGPPAQFVVRRVEPPEVSINPRGGVVRAVMTTPRLGFQDMADCVRGALWPLGIELQRVGGAFWEQGITEAINKALQEGAQYILALDYDSIFLRDTIEGLLALMAACEDVDAISTLQCHRGRGTPLFSIRRPDGWLQTEISREALSGELLKASTAHLGCTLFRAQAFRRCAKPWFKGEPDEQGEWTQEGKTDPDMWFWRQWERAGNSLWIAPRLTVGHLQNKIMWPDMNLQPIYQEPAEFWKVGVPDEVWR